MKFYSKLYVGGKAQKQKRKILYKLMVNAGQSNVYLITDAANGQDIFDIVSSAFLKQKVFRRNLPTVVGIACGYEEAVEVVTQIVEETYRETGSMDVRRYLAQKAKKE